MTASDYLAKRYAVGEDRVAVALMRAWTRRYPDRPMRPDVLLRHYDAALLRLSLAETEAADKTTTAQQKAAGKKAARVRIETFDKHVFRKPTA